MESDNLSSGSTSETELDPEVCSLYITYSLVVDGHTSREFLYALSQVASREDEAFQEEVRASFTGLLSHYERHGGENRADIDPRIDLDRIREAQLRYEKARMAHRAANGAGESSPFRYH